MPDDLELDITTAVDVVSKDDVPDWDGGRDEVFELFMENFGSGDDYEDISSCELIHVATKNLWILERDSSVVAWCTAPLSTAPQRIAKALIHHWFFKVNKWEFGRLIDCDFPLNDLFDELWLETHEELSPDEDEGDSGGCPVCYSDGSCKHKVLLIDPVNLSIDGPVDDASRSAQAKFAEAIEAFTDRLAKLTIPESTDLLAKITDYRLSALVSDLVSAKRRNKAEDLQSCFSSYLQYFSEVITLPGVSTRFLDRDDAPGMSTQTSVYFSETPEQTACDAAAVIERDADALLQLAATS